MATLSNPFAKAAARAVAEVLEMSPDDFVVGTPPRPELGDFAVGCFPAAKQHKKPPPALAVQVVEKFEAGDHLIEAAATGPFVNFKANRPALFRHLLSRTLGDSLDLFDTSEGDDKTICIDYSSPNISKHLAYHHIRSTVIGHALVNLYRAIGYRVIGINHLGDWGTTHGMLLAAYKMWGDDLDLDTLTVDQLNDLYVRFRAAMKEDDSLADQGRAWFKKLEDGDEEATRLWKRFREVSWVEYQSVYDVLGIVFDEVRGESDYVADMPAVLEMLDKKGLSSISQGALVVQFDDEKMPPMLLRKQDGATLYGTRDLAAAMYRHKTYDFARNLYVVDRGQGLHFKQLFLTLTMAGHDWAAKCAHIPFGLVRIGGKKAGTRSGNVVLLKDVLAEAQQRSHGRIKENNPEWDEARIAKVARMVGVGAIVFANLVSQRDKDVDFNWDDVLSVEGDSGPYVQYAHARCASIVRKADRKISQDVTVESLTHDSEWALALKLLDIGDVASRAADTNDPHLLSRYLLELCATYSRWYTIGNQDKSLRVLTDEREVSDARLALVAASQAVLAAGLAVLGIDAPDAM